MMATTNQPGKFDRPLSDCLEGCMAHGNDTLSDLSRRRFLQGAALAGASAARNRRDRHYGNRSGTRQCNLSCYGEASAQCALCA